MSREEDWGARRPNTRSRRRKPYNDDYKDDEYSVRDRVRRNYTQDDDYSYDSRRYDRRSEEWDDDEPAYPRRDQRTTYRDEDDPRRNQRTTYRDEDEPRRERRTTYRDEEPADSRRRQRQSRRDYEEPVRRQRGRRRRRGGGCLPLVILLVLLLVVLIGGVAAIASLWSEVDSADFGRSDVAVNSDLPDTVRTEQKNYRTFMIFGVDSRDNTTLQAGTLADSNIIVSVNKRTGKVKLLSIYRDTYVETTDGERMKLTEVYNKYGAKEQLATINKNFDMNVTEYVTVNWKTVADTINLLGGLDLELSEGECEGINKYIDEVMNSTGISSSHVDVYDGTQHLDGVQAVTYCRLRKGLGDDYKRTERQRTVITATLNKAKSSGPVKAVQVCRTVFPGLSSSLSLPEVLTLAAGMGRYDIEDSAGFPFDSRSQDGGRYYLFPTTLESNVRQLHEYLYGTEDFEPSGTVKDLSQRIQDAAGG